MFTARDFITGERFAIVQDEHGYARTANLPDDLSPYYGSAYYGGPRGRFISAIEWGVKGFRGARVRTLLHFYAGDAPGRVLDVGCGRGVMLAELHTLGWEAVGTEIAPELAAASQAFPVHVQADLSACAFDAASFDVVTFWHTLEHIRDPFAALDEAARVLKPGGLLLVEVPNFSSWQARLTRGGWFHLDVPRHTYHFTAAQVVALLQARGFEVIHTRTFSLEYGYYGFVQSLLNLFTLYPNFLYSLLRKQTGVLTDRLPTSLWDVFISVALLPLVIPFALVAETIASALGHGSVIRVVGRKEG